MHSHFTVVGVVAAAIVGTASAEFVYTDDFAQWTSLVPPYTNIDFVGLPQARF